MTYKDILQLREDYISGKIKTLPLYHSPYNFGLNDLGKNLSLSKGSYLLFGGQSGTGKTAFVDNEFVLKILWLLYYKEDFDMDIKWIYRSMERSERYKITKWMCWFIYVKYRVLMDVPTFLGMPDKKRDLNDKEKKLIVEAEDFYDNVISKYVVMMSGATNPTGIRNFTRDYMRKLGWEIKSEKEEIRVNGKAITKFTTNNFDEAQNRYFEVLNVAGKSIKVLQYEHQFIYRDPSKTFVQIHDHIGKIKKERDFNDKQVLDKHSEYCGIFRDVFDFIVIDIQQLNRNINDTLRRVKSNFTVLDSDFKGSGDIYENVDLVMGLLDPFKAEKYEYLNYDVTKFVHNGYNRFRALKVLKNSFGISDFYKAYAFEGGTGFFKQLPKPDNMKDQIYNDIKNAKFI